MKTSVGVMDSKRVKDEFLDLVCILRDLVLTAELVVETIRLNAVA